MMALCMITTFVMFNALSALNNALESFNISIDHDLHRYMVPLANLLICLNRYF